MKRFALCALALALAGCHSPIAPTSTERTVPEEVVVTTPPAPPAPPAGGGPGAGGPAGPIHHNIPATMADGTVVWLCETQDREYYDPRTGATGVERDHYIQSTPCPEEPIK